MAAFRVKLQIQQTGPRGRDQSDNTAAHEVALVSALGIPIPSIGGIFGKVDGKTTVLHRRNRERTIAASIGAGRGEQPGTVSTMSVAISTVHGAGKSM
jgi:hypothetical protein